MTLVSLGFPVYNGENYLEAALDAALSQTHQDLEIIVSDNGSTDRTEEICRHYAAIDARVLYHREETNRGPSWNHTYVVETARGDYFRWSHHDDSMHPDLVSHCLAALGLHPEAVLAFPGAYMIDEGGEIIREYPMDLPWAGDDPVTRLKNLLEPPLRESLIELCYPMFSLMRRDVLLTTRMIGSYQSADKPLLVEMALRGPWIQVPERLLYKRNHPGTSSGPGKSKLHYGQWFRPGVPLRTTPMAHTQLLGAYIDAIRRAPLTRAEQLACMRVVLGWVFRERNGRMIFQEFRQHVRERVSPPTRANEI